MLESYPRFYIIHDMNIYLEKIKNFLNSDTTEAKIANVTLGVIAIAGVTSLAFIAAGMGNGTQVFSMFKRSKKYSKAQINSAMKSLYRRKFIEYVSDKNGVTKVRITTKGVTKLKSFSIDILHIQKPNRWDNKWRLVMFDLPIRFSKGRDALRFKLKQLGFVQFQKSVWIFPYPCTDEVLFIADYYKITKYIEILEVSTILNDQKLKKHFKVI